MKKKDTISKFDRPPLKLKVGYTRPGSMTVLEAPSRIHNTLYYPDGTTTHDNQAHGKDNRNP